MTLTPNTNRSASPLSTRPNPNFRSTELNNPIRKSCSGNPFAKSSMSPNPRSLNGSTPIISPSDFGLRNSMDKIGGSLYEANGKENESEQTPKSVKMRSSSVPKTSKHFMAPTISTVSKITAPSPRKKVLTDKHFMEPTRTSINGMENSDSKAHIESISNIVDPSIDSKLPFSNSSVSESDVVTDVESNIAGGDLSSNFDVNPSPLPYSPRPIIAPLDADPLVAPPYDPKTNFLSPRPQFLHYRPNPRIGSYVHDDNLTFESLSDTETTEESGSASSEELVADTEDDNSSVLNEKIAFFESLVDTDQTTKETEIAPEGLVRETEGDLSVENKVNDSDPISTQLDVKGGESKRVLKLVRETEGDSSVENKVNDSDPISTQLDVKGGESKRVLKKPFFTKMESISFILMLVVAACLSISLIDNQNIETPPIKDHAFVKILDDPSGIAEYVKESYVGVAEKISFWSSNCIGYFTKLIHLPKPEEKWSALQLANLTALQDDPYGQQFTMGGSSKMGGEIVLVDEKGLNDIEEYEVEDVSESETVSEVEDQDEPEAQVTEDKIFETENEYEVEEETGADSEALDAPENEDSEDVDLDEPEKADSEAKDVDEPENVDSVLSSNVHADLDELEKADSEANDVDGPENVGNEVPLLSSNQYEVLDEPENPMMIQPENNCDAESPNTEEIRGSSEPTVSSNLDEIPTANNNPEAKSSSLTSIFGVCLLATSLVFATTLLVVKKRKSFKPKETVTTKAFSATKWTHDSPSCDNDSPTEVIMESEPCQSEWSSYEAQSGENSKMARKRSAKRDSLASSSNFSMGSPSYGSFTRYEIFQKNMATRKKEW